MTEIREWDMSNRDHMDEFKRDRVKKLPSIAINGELVYESLIPDQEELIDMIRKRLNREQTK
ncbi:thioredoxin family protein [bacterium]|nr:thioredoxin family protein [bacterium]